MAQTKKKAYSAAPPLKPLSTQAVYPILILRELILESRSGGISLHTVAAKLKLPPSTVYRNVLMLKRLGVFFQKQHDADKRAVRYIVNRGSVMHLLGLGFER